MQSASSFSSKHPLLVSWPVLVAGEESAKVGAIRVPALAGIARAFLGMM